jgi:hypothetical protein
MVVTWDLVSRNGSTATWRAYILCCCLVLAVLFGTQPVSGEVFTSSFLVRLHGEPGNEIAHRVAARNGFENLGPVSFARIIILAANV